MPETILIVDDDPRVLQGYARMLKFNGYPPLLATSGAEALERYTEAHPAIVLTDVRMPDMDGFALLHALRARDPEVEVLLITGHGDLPMAIEALRAGAADFLLKPLQPEALQVALERAVERLYLKRELRAAHAALEAQTLQLDAHVRELDCLNIISNLIARPDLTLEAFLHQVVNTIPLVYPQPETTCACIRLDGQTYTAAGCDAHTRLHSLTLPIHGARAGTLTIYASRPLPETGAETLATIARQLGEAIEHHRVKTTLRESAEFHRALIACLPVALFSLDLEGRVLSWNASAERMLGWSAAEAVGKPLPIVAPDKQAEFAALRQQVLEQRNFMNHEIRRQRKDGCQFDASLSAAPLYNAEGQVIGLLGALEDITARKAAQAALERAHAELEDRVAARTAELAATNRRLEVEIQERKQIEDALLRYGEEQAALYIVTAAIAGHLEIEPLLEAALDAILPTVHARAGWVYAPGTEATQPPRLLAQRGLPETVAEALTAQPLAHYPIAHALFFTNSAENINPVIYRLDRAPQPVIQAQAQVGLHTRIGVPIRAANRALALLVLAWETPQDETALPQNLLTTIGYQLGLALRNAHLYQQARQVDRLRSINAIGAAAIASLDPEVVLREVMTLTCAALHATEGSILLRNAETDELSFAQTLHPAAATLLGQRLAPGQGLAGWVAEQRETLCINDVTQEPRWFGGVDAQTGFATYSLLAAPLLYRGAVTGVIEIVNKQTGPFTEEDAHLLEAIAAIAAIALQNARLYTDLRDSLRKQEATQAQLVHAEKIAALGRLAASVAHEINNPLQAVTGYLDLTVEKLPLPERLPDLQRYLGTARREIERISQIVRRMHEFYRPAHAGFQPTDLHAVLESVLDLSHKQMQHSHIRVEQARAETLPLIEANADQLKQVFLNLVLNAIDAMPGGGVLTITAEMAQISQTPAVRVTVRDTGVGIAETDRERMFEPFFTTKAHGAGLGLAISYGIVEGHGGEIEVSSTPGAGATFTVTLPLQPPRGQRSDSVTQP